MAWIDEGLLLRLPYIAGDNLKETVELLQAELAGALRHIAWAVNVLDESNFPNGLSGGKVLKEDHSTPLTVLNITELSIPLVLSAQPVSTTSFLSCGGFFTYSPLKFPGGVWYLEAALQVTSGGTVTVELVDDAGVVGSVSSTDSSWRVVRSNALVMPVSDTVLRVVLSSSDPSYTAQLWTARLIWVP